MSIEFTILSSIRRFFYTADLDLTKVLSSRMLEVRWGKTVGCKDNHLHPPPAGSPSVIRAGGTRAAMAAPPFDQLCFTFVQNTMLFYSFYFICFLRSPPLPPCQGVPPALVIIHEGRARSIHFTLWYDRYAPLGFPTVIPFRKRQHQETSIPCYYSHAV